LEGLRVTCLMSHLACADTPDHPLNRRQLDAFRSTRERLPPVPGSLANSSGIFLGPEYHADLVRPGAALYGLAPFRGRLNPMAQVVRLEARILQVREIDTGCTVGYGAMHCADRPERIATVAAGYADGYLRSLSNRGSGSIAGHRVPLVGRVSMDLITFDVSDVPQEHVFPGAMVELIGPDYPVDAVAADAGTIGYEILTALGPRYRRVYVGG
jgi:alanine racemase